MGRRATINPLMLNELPIMLSKPLDTFFINGLRGTSRPYKKMAKGAT